MQQELHLLPFVKQRLCVFVEMVERDARVFNGAEQYAIACERLAGLPESMPQGALARALFFDRLGEQRDRTFESQFYRASGLNLLINAIVYWNTLYLQPAFAELNREGVPTQTDVIKHITPLGWQHIGLTGDYICTAADGVDLRPLRQETSILAARSPYILKSRTDPALSCRDAYGVVVTAFALRPASPITALRETSVVFAVLIGWLFLGETVTTRRILACLIVAAGAILLGHSKLLRKSRLRFVFCA